MGQQTDTRDSFFHSLLTDTTANTLAISAASLVPLLAMVGGGVDASRYYMAEARLQAACDAGALAARRAMDDGEFSSADEEIGDNFFVQNYPDDLFGIEGLEHDFSSTDGDEVVGTATGTMPTTIMGAFGFDDIELSVECAADINISNTDVVFVLDVTGSMNCVAGDTSCTNNGNVEATDSKIDNLRASVLTFYDTVELSTSESAQVRFGIVPYANQVNVGDSLNAEWLASTHTYQTRVPDWETGSSEESTSIEYDRTSGASNWRYQGVETRTWYGLTLSQCQNRANNAEFDIYNSSDSDGWTQVSQTGSNPVVTTYTGTVTYEYYSTNWDYSQSYRNSDGRCRLNQNFYLYDATSDITETVFSSEPTTTWVGYIYKQVDDIDVSTVKANGYLVAPTGENGVNVTHTWNGCIEEADTVDAATFDPVPLGAYDLLIDLVPSNEDEKWKPMLPSMVWPRHTGSSFNYQNGSNDWTRNEVRTDKNLTQPTTYCPKAARKLAPFDSREDLDDWLKESNGFEAEGSTYHDFGMIWGGRFISPDGIFASENSSAPNGDAISRHIVFMTDGTQSTNNYVYGLYGLEWWDRRVTANGSQSQMSSRHAARFQAACRAARNKNISVWVVAFDTFETDGDGNPVVPAHLEACATPGRAYLANDADELDDAFREIAEKIAALRLTN